MVIPTDNLQEFHSDFSDLPWQRLQGQSLIFTAMISDDLGCIGYDNKELFGKILQGVKDFLMKVGQDSPI